jgi:hypothetical protein
MLDGELVVTLRDRFLGIGLPAQIRGKVEVRDGTRLNFMPDGAELGPLGIPQTALDVALAILNPVVDLKDLPFGMTIQEFVLRPGELEMAGTASPPLPFPLNPPPSPTVTPQ